MPTHCNPADQAPAPTQKYVAYYRVSTRTQNLGIDAQMTAIYSGIPKSDVVAEFSEKESGAHDDRRQLAAAIAKAKSIGAVLVVAKADRLSRDLAFAAQVVFKVGVPVKCLDMPNNATSDPLLFGVYFGLAQKERELISQRTKAALAEKKAQGYVLGNPHDFSDEERQRSSITLRRRADENPNNVRAANEMRRYLAEGGERKLQRIADHLNTEGFYTSTGVLHTPTSVRLLMKRYGI